MQIPQRHYRFALHGALTMIIFVLHVQAQTGFVNIDCGLLPENTIYEDTNTGLEYISDASYIDSGVSKNISTTFRSEFLDQQLQSVRSFPEGIRNCYTLSSPIRKNKTFLIRARFLYGNYDGKNKLPEFDLYLGVTLWDTIKVKDASKVIDKEIIHVINSDNVYLCLVNKDFGTPFISAIELRKLSSDAYPTDPPTSLMNYFRYDIGSSATGIVRYGDDSYDRFWQPYTDLPASWTPIKTSFPVDSNRQDKNNGYSPGSAVMQTAVTPTDPSQSQPLNIISWQPDVRTTNFYVYLHFAEIQQLQLNQSRVFNITINGKNFFKYEQPTYLYTNTIYSPMPLSALRFDFALVKTANSTVPPLINAIEVYTTRNIKESQTVQGDVDALLKIKSTYGVKKNWQGDPCAPENFVWDGIQCSSDTDASSIISLNLSSSGLVGNISSYISNLKFIQILDLSYNNLSGTVPDFLGQMTNLSVINLNSNNLSGLISEELLKKNKTESFRLSLDGNQNICFSGSCDSNKDGGTNNSKKVAIIAVVAVGVSLLVIIATMIYLYGKTKTQGISEPSTRSKLKAKNQPYTYNEVLRMTNNFDTAIGEGGFGKVYLGTLDNGIKVAVKMLSLTSQQGYKEFEAEAQLLMVVHHRNLVSLVGYCDDIRNVALIYEYMPAGNLMEHLSEKSTKVLSWIRRLQIAVDAAQGLDYLHHGCKPPIIHRDLKSSNILLNGNMQAKIGDFGLSKAFEAENQSYISTCPAGTLGYLDPEFQSSGNLCKKSDVYSFGIILFELITGRSAIFRGPNGNTHILQWVTPIIQSGDIESIVDSRLKTQFSINSAWKAVEIAMSCVPTTAIQRADINHVLQQLKECLDMEICWSQTNEINKKSGTQHKSLQMTTIKLDFNNSPSER